MDRKALRSLCLRLSMLTYTGMEFYTSVPVPELLEMAEEIAEVMKNG